MAVISTDSATAFSQTETVEIRQALLSWYDVNHRVLPWRRNPHSKRVLADPAYVCPPAGLPLNEFIYYVWVCEVMSQQTQLPRVIEYYRRWTARWPTVQALAAATQDEVNAAWAGLGYYRRARYLLEGAQYVVAEHGGVFPRTSRELQKTPGVGAYTGNAIASIACGERTAVVDANVVRVLARLRRITGNPKTSAKLHAALADALLDPDRPGDFNQAVMELGATVCTVHQPPDCAGCPINRQCQAYGAVLAHQQSGGDPGDPDAPPSVTAYPSKVEKAKRSEQTVATCVLEVRTACGGPGRSQLLLVQRPKDGLLAGLWEFPSQPVAAGASQKERRAAVDALLGRLFGREVHAAMRARDRRHLGAITHIFSHIRMTLQAEKLVLECDELPMGGSAACEPAMRWVASGQLQGEGLSSSVVKIAKLAAAQDAGAKKGIKRFFAVTSAKNDDDEN